MSARHDIHYRRSLLFFSAAALLAVAATAQVASIDDAGITVDLSPPAGVSSTPPVGLSTPQPGPASGAQPSVALQPLERK